MEMIIHENKSSDPNSMLSLQVLELGVHHLPNFVHWKKEELTVI
jgi:hypothetical protein